MLIKEILLGMFALVIITQLVLAFLANRITKKNCFVEEIF